MNVLILILQLIMDLFMIMLLAIIKVINSQHKLLMSIQLEDIHLHNYSVDSIIIKDNHNFVGIEDKLVVQLFAIPRKEYPINMHYFKLVFVLLTDWDL